MEIFSAEFFLILLIAILILSFRARRKRKGPAIVQGKQISIRGQKISSPVNRSTPLPCLLDEGRSFGEDFKDKTPPELPHNERCRCELVQVSHRSHDWFNDKNALQEQFDTDLGSLERKEFRYYKYMLISMHPDADETTRSDYQELARGISISPGFEETVVQHLKSKA